MAAQEGRAALAREIRADQECKLPSVRSLLLVPRLFNARLARRMGQGHGKWTSFHTNCGIMSFVCMSSAEPTELQYALAHGSGNKGLFRELNPGPLAPEARIMPLDQTASCKPATKARRRRAQAQQLCDALGVPSSPAGLNVTFRNLRGITPLRP